MRIICEFRNRKSGCMLPKCERITEKCNRCIYDTSDLNSPERTRRLGGVELSYFDHALAQTIALDLAQAKVVKNRRFGMMKGLVMHIWHKDYPHEFLCKICNDYDEILKAEEMPRPSKNII